MSSPAASSPPLERWRLLEFPPGAALLLSRTLVNGQCFHWTQSPARPDEWTGVVARWVFALRQSAEDGAARLHWTALNVPLTPDDADGDVARWKEAEDALRDYLNLDACAAFARACGAWICSRDAAHASLRAAASALSLGLPEPLPSGGVGLLRQEPFECLLSFICSANNNIARITDMLQRFRERYGALLHVQGERRYYAFPSAEQCCAEVDVPVLRALGFGYRAEYVLKTVHLLRDLTRASSASSRGGLARGCWLRALREDKENFTDARLRETLQQFAGVGPKVADCVALYSLDRANLVPLDTHMKALLPRLYGSPERFAALYAPHAGWVQSLLFTARVFPATASPSRASPSLSERKRALAAPRRTNKRAKLSLIGVMR